MTLPTLRRAAVADAALLAALGARMFTDTFAADNQPDDLALYLSETFDPELQATELADPAVTVYLAETAAGPIGYGLVIEGGDAPDDVALAAPNGRLLEISRLYVDQASIGTGVGALLMTRLIEHGRATGCDGVWLGVWERNSRAIRFYERFGYRDVGSHVFTVGTDPQTDRLMLRLPL